MTRIRYFDASAIVKLVVDEPESHALRDYARAPEATSTSIVGVIESRRAAVRRGGIDADELAFALRGFDSIDLDSSIAEDAARLGPATMRALDAIHLASARQLGSDLEALVTYDQRMIEAAGDLGLPVASPGASPRRRSDATTT